MVKSTNLTFQQTLHYYILHNFINTIRNKTNVSYKDVHRHWNIYDDSKSIINFSMDNEEIFWTKNHMFYARGEYGEICRHL